MNIEYENKQILQNGISSSKLKSEAERGSVKNRVYLQCSAGNIYKT